MIKNVFLDLDDTLLNFQKGERVALVKTFKKIGIDPTEELINRYLRINLDCWRALERGEMTKDEVLFGRFERLFSEYRISASVTKTQEIYEELLSKEYDFLPGAKELLDDFKSCGRYRLFMATNGIPSVQNPRLDGSGVRDYFEGIFISEEIGFAKPSKAFFDECFNRIDGFRHEETIIVGDSLSSDVKGGLNAGILTCHFNPREIIYDGIKPHYTIKKLDELLPLLDSIE